MEAPEKIYLDIRGFENVDIPFSFARKRFGVPYYEHPVSTNDVEYTRTDAFIEKALEWIRENIRPYYHEVRYKYEDFQNYMKGE